LPETAEYRYPPKTAPTRSGKIKNRAFGTDLGAPGVALNLRVQLNLLVYHALSDAFYQGAFSDNVNARIFPPELRHNKILKESQFASTDLVL
jgi:hypothetical protein